MLLPLAALFLLQAANAQAVFFPPWPLPPLPPCPGLNCGPVVAPPIPLCTLNPALCLPPPPPPLPALQVCSDGTTRPAGTCVVRRAVSYPKIKR